MRRILQMRCVSMRPYMRPYRHEYWGAVDGAAGEVISAGDISGFAGDISGFSRVQLAGY